MIGIVITIRAPWKAVHRFIKYYLSDIGVDLIYIYFDDPSYAYLEEVKQFNNKVIAICCDDAYWKNKAVERSIALIDRQRVNLQDAHEMSKNHSIKWLIHLDDDERLLPRNIDLTTELEQYSKTIDIVRFPVYEYIPENSSLVQVSDRFFRTQPLRARDNVLPILTDRVRLFLSGIKFKCIKVICISCGLGYIYQFGYLKAYTAGKSAFRVKDKANFKYGLHCPIPFPNQSLSSAISRNTLVLHYDCLNFETWFEKFKNKTGHTPHNHGQQLNKETEVNPQRAEQSRRFEENYLNNDIEANKHLFSEIYELPVKVRWLFKIAGFLCSIKDAPY